MVQNHYEDSRLVEKERYFREFAVWPTYNNFDSDGWLRNFNLDEKWVAEHLLSNFLYFNEMMTNSLLRASINYYFGGNFEFNDSATNGRREVLNETAFVVCEGENPNPTDSGNLFARKIRAILSIPEENIYTPCEALVQRNKYSRFIFIDDFAGSGNQFVETWRRKYTFNGIHLSFDDLSNSNGTNLLFAYCCCIATEKANRKILEKAPCVDLSPAHMISDHYCVVNPVSPIWENMDADNAIEIIENASRRAGCTTGNWRGFNDLGLSLAFNHGIPDASLPIFHSQHNGWVPLIKRY